MVGESGARPWRREPLPREWATLRRAVLERDGHQCTWVTGKHDGGWDPVAQVPREGGPPDNTPLTELTGYIYDVPARCTNTGGEVDHTRGPGEHHPSLLRTLCTHHHQWRTSKMAAMARWEKHNRQKGEPHPGLKRNR